MAPLRKAAPQETESDESYAHRVLTQIFRVTIDPHHMTNEQGQRLTFLSNLNEELNDANEPLRLSPGNLDQAIIEACSSWPENKPLMNFLLPCWKRALRASNISKLTTGPRFEVLEEAKRLCISNSLFALTMPVLYGSVLH